MGVKVVFDGPRGYAARRWFRAGAVLVGIAMQTVAGLAFLPAVVGVILVPLTLIGALAEDGGLELAGQVAILWLMLVALFLIGTYTGGFLIRGNRGLVLFLRRFRHDEAIQVVTSAVRGIGRTWRVVTLDDATIVPVGVVSGLRHVTSAATRLSAFYAWVQPRLDKLGARERSAERVWKIVMKAALVGCAALAALMLWRRDELSLLLDYPNSPEAVAFRVLLVVLGVGVALYVVLLGGALLLMCVGLVALPLVGLLTPLADVPAQVRKADGVTTATVCDRTEIDDVAKALATISRATVSPRIAVLTVETAVWRYAVTSLAGISSAPLIDVSRPTQHLLWEVEELGRLHGSRCVFVGHLDRLRRFTPTTGSIDVLAVTPNSITGRLETLLDGHEVLAYTTDRRGRRRFTRALFARLEGLPRTRQERRRTFLLGLAELAGVAAFTADLALLIGIAR
ncbi:hypothetical protein [Streptomyces spiralis]|uniref:hypothetical protein n=1 Tax=Streptomyces spiralis TaxID=66376 RepID=UPI0034094F5F